MPLFGNNDDDGERRRSSASRLNVVEPPPVIIQARGVRNPEARILSGDPIADAVGSLDIAPRVDFSQVSQPSTDGIPEVTLDPFRSLLNFDRALEPIRSSVAAIEPSEFNPSGGGSTFQPSTGGSRRDLGSIDSFTTALRTQESGGNYQAIGPSTRYGTAKGAYQFIDETWQRWARQVGVNTSTATQASPAQQDAVARYAFQQLFAKYNDWGLVAIAWHAGEGTANRVARSGGSSGTNDGIIDTDNYAANILRMAGF